MTKLNSSQQNAVNEVRDRMRALDAVRSRQNLVFDLSDEVVQAVYLFYGLGISSAADIRISPEGLFQYKKDGNVRWQRCDGHILSWFDEVINDPSENGHLLWAKDVVSLPNKPDREKKAVEKLFNSICNNKNFNIVYDVMKNDDNWTDPFEGLVVPDSDESSEAESELPERHVPAKRAVDKSNPDAKSRRVRVRRQSSSDSEDSEDSQAAGEAEPGSSKKDEDFQPSDGSDPESSSDSGSDSDEDRALRRLTPAAVAAAAREAAAAASRSWMEKICKTVADAKEKGMGDLLDDFATHGPVSNAKHLRGARKSCKKKDKVRAQPRTCAFADDILKARQSKSPGVREYLVDPSKWKRQLSTPQIDIVEQCLGLFVSPVCLSRAIVSAGVGVGKTSAAVALAAVLSEGLVENFQIDVALVIAPPHITKQWKAEIESTLGDRAIVEVCPDSPSILDSYLDFYEQLYHSNVANRVVPAFFIVPSQVVGRLECMEVIHMIVQTLSCFVIVDEPHLYFKRKEGKAGGSLAGLFQYTRGAKVLGKKPLPGVFLTATLLCKGGEASSVLSGMLGLDYVLPSEALKDDEIAQGIIHALSVCPPADPSLQVQPPVQYNIDVESPEVDPEMEKSKPLLARLMRAGNNKTSLENPLVGNSLVVSEVLRNVLGISSLMFYDNKRGVDEVREAVRPQPFGKHYYFLEGSMSQAERDDELRRLMADPEKAVLITTIAILGAGTNLYGKLQAVIFVGPNTFDYATDEQCVGRVARPPLGPEIRVLALVIRCQDKYSLGSEKIMQHKKAKTATVAGAAVVETGKSAKGPEEGLVRRRPTAKVEDLPHIIAGLWTLAQRGIAINPDESSCISLSHNSKLQAPPTTSEASKAQPEIIRALQEAAREARDPAAAAEKAAAEKAAAKQAAAAVLARHMQAKIARAQKAAAEKAAADKAAAEKAAADKAAAEKAAAEQAAAKKAAAAVLARHMQAKNARAQKAAAEKAAADQAAAEKAAADIAAAERVADERRKAAAAAREKLQLAKLRAETLLASNAEAQKEHDEAEAQKGKIDVLLKKMGLGQGGSAAGSSASLESELKSQAIPLHTLASVVASAKDDGKEEDFEQEWLKFRQS